MNEFNQEKPKMELKSQENGVVYEIGYAGNIMILTKDEYSRLKDKAIRFDQDRKRWDKEREGYKLEIQRLKNQIRETEQRRSEEARREKAMELAKKPSQEALNAKAKALVEQMGQGRPSKLLDSHKDFLRGVVGQEAKEGKRYRVKSLYAHLVKEYGYTGGEEPVRKYLSDLRKTIGATAGPREPQQAPESHRGPQGATGGHRGPQGPQRATGGHRDPLEAMGFGKALREAKRPGETVKTPDREEMDKYLRSLGIDPNAPGGR